jgi:hypothetical protein
VTVFLRTHSGERREEALKPATTGPAVRRWDIALDEFAAIPRTPLCYWAPHSARQTFRAFPSMDAAGFDARVGLQSSDDFRWLRCWWESEPGQRFLPYSKGGPYQPYYCDIEMTVDWQEDGRSMEVSKLERLRMGQISANNSRNWNSDFYRRRGLTWPCRSHAFSARVLPSDVVIGNMGPGLFHADDSNAELLALLALLDSHAVAFLLGLQVSRIELASKYDAGLVRGVPCPPLAGSLGTLSALAERGWSLMRSLDTVSEVSHAFVVPAVLQVDGDSFDAGVLAWGERVAAVESELGRVQSEIDELCFELYGISDEDRRAITEGFGVTDSDDDEGGSDDDDESGSEVELDPVGLAAGLVSWAIGVAVGRFDVRLATGEREWPVEPDPFDPLPVCSPGMLTGDDGLPLESPPDGYPIVPSPVLVDDPGHELDLTARVRSVFDVVFGDQADAWWSDVGAVLDTKNGVEGWLRRGFFDHHLKTYSKSRRKAPIMWPIGTKSGSYRVWLYAHQVTNDTLFRVLGDVVEPKLATEQRRLSDVTQEYGPSPSASQRRTLDAQQSLVDELIELRDELRAVAPLWHPDLNDGIVIVLAPLWRLFAHHRAWSKELRDRWASSRRVSTTGRSSPCTSGPNASYPSAPTTAASRSPTTSKTPSGPKTTPTPTSGTPDGHPPPARPAHRRPHQPHHHHRTNPPQPMTRFLRVLDAKDKADSLRGAIESLQRTNVDGGALVIDVDPDSFGGVPRSPFAYWVSDGLLFPTRLHLAFVGHRRGCALAPREELRCRMRLWCRRCCRCDSADRRSPAPAGPVR